jgi:UDP:flavonoid glycosyltransferase YjiC (YdhE family)
LQTVPEEVIACAMAQGVIALLPPSFASPISNGPTRRRVDGMLRLADQACADPRRMRHWAKQARALARKHYSPSLHEARLMRLVGRPAKPVRARAPRTGSSRVLFISSNGVGLGHLTRLLAIARRLPDNLEPVFATLSQAIPIVESAGYPVEHIPFHVYTNSDPDPWNHWLAEQLGQIIRFHDCRAIVFDGSAPYYGLVKTMAPPGLKAVWIRRGMWQERQNMSGALQRARFFDLVIEPGDVAESVDRGASRGDGRRQVLKVPPIRLLDSPELHDRSAAAAKLGLDPTRPAVLIQLGSGWNRDLTSILDTLLTAIAARPEVQPVLVEWLIAHRELAIWPQVPRLKGFPVTKYYNAFDFTISAAGYNSFNEIISFGLPAIFIANQHPMTDDQAGRALYAVENEAAFQLPETQLDGVGRLLDLVLDEKVRTAMKMNCLRLARPNGANLAADAIAALVE